MGYSALKTSISGSGKIILPPRCKNAASRPVQCGDPVLEHTVNHLDAPVALQIQHDELFDDAIFLRGEHEAEIANQFLLVPERAAHLGELRNHAADLPGDFSDRTLLLPVNFVRGELQARGIAETTRRRSGMVSV